jgi:hypothetical protein
MNIDIARAVLDNMADECEADDGYEKLISVMLDAKNEADDKLAAVIDKDIAIVKEHIADEKNHLAELVVMLLHYDGNIKATTD